MLNSRYGRAVVVEEAWFFRESDQRGTLTICGAVVVEPKVIGIFVIQDTGPSQYDIDGAPRRFVDIYADEQQFKQAGCERPGYETIFPRKS